MSCPFNFGINDRGRWRVGPLRCAAGLGVLCAIVLALQLTSAVSAVAAVPEDVTFRTLHRDGAMLRAFLVKPGGGGPFPVVLLLHGCSGPVTASGRIAARESAWMDMLVSEGYAALLLDSFNPRGFASICTLGDRPISAEEDRPFDAYAALGWLRAQAFADPERIAIFGWSHGAMTTLSAISEATMGKIGWSGPGFRTAVAFYPGCLTVSKTPYGTDVPLLMQLGEKDDWTPARYCHRLVDRLRREGRNVAVDTYTGAYHAFDSPSGGVHRREINSGGGKRLVHVGANPAARASAITRIKAWLAAWLRQ